MVAGCSGELQAASAPMWIDSRRAKQWSTPAGLTKAMAAGDAGWWAARECGGGRATTSWDGGGKRQLGMVGDIWARRLGERHLGSVTLSMYLVASWSTGGIGEQGGDR